MNNKINKYIRPSILIYLTAFVSLLSIATLFWLTPDRLPILKLWLELFTVLLAIVYSFYFASRGIEKVTEMKAAKKKDE